MDSTEILENPMGALVGYGGGLHATLNTSVNIKGCTFRGNHADVGGGMYTDNPETVPVTISDTMFSSNTASSICGGLYAWHLIGSSLNFLGNASQRDGGGTCVVSQAAFDNCSWDENYTSYATSPIGELWRSAPDCASFTPVGYGGAIRLESATEASFESCTFRGNAAAVGGAVGQYLGSIPSSPPTMTFSNCTFNANRAWCAVAGALYSQSHTVLVDTTFSSNTASTAGAIYQNSGSLEMVGGVIDDNDATRLDTSWDGTAGAVLVQVDASFTDVYFSNNSAATYGGGLYTVWGGDHVSVTGCTFAYNRAGTLGGGIYWAGVPVPFDLTRANTYLGNTPDDLCYYMVEDLEYTLECVDLD